MCVHIVVVVMDKGMMIAAVGLSWDAAHDMRNKLESTGIYNSVSVGSVGSYFPI
jgi:hypothetical protein